MITQLFSIGIIMLLSAMLPGPDFAIVTKNAILHSRRAGIITTLGVVTAIVVHMTYCLLGLAIIISQSILLFNIIKYIGAAYIVYLGVMSIFSKQDKLTFSKTPNKVRGISDWKAFRQGFLTNLLNPKATLFFLALFTVIIKPNTPHWLQAAYAIEMLVIAFAWFACLTVLLSHHRVLRVLNRVENYVAKVLGVFLIGFGAALAFVKPH